MAIDLWRTRPMMGTTLGRVVDRLFDEAFSPFYAGRDGGGGGGAGGGGGGGSHTGLQSLPVTIWETDETTATYFE